VTITMSAIHLGIAVWILGLAAIAAWVKANEEPGPLGGLAALPEFLALVAWFFGGGGFLLAWWVR
jgi:hypothetical protein